MRPSGLRLEAGLSMVKAEAFSSLFRGWVPEGSLAEFCGVHFRGLAGHQSPGRPSKNVGGEAPHMLEGLPGPPGPAKPPKRTQNNPAKLPSGTQLQALSGRLPREDFLEEASEA